MSYSQFSLESIKATLGITLFEKFGTFADIPEVTYSDFLKETLRYNIPLALAIASEKARSELLITPILVELRKQSVASRNEQLTTNNGQKD